MARTQEQLAQELTDLLRGLENRAIDRIGRVWTSALRDTVRRVSAKLDSYANQPDYDPATTPGAFLGSTPDGQVGISPTQKNLAGLTLEGQLLQELRGVLAEFPLTTRQQQQIDGELEALFDQAQALGTEYALELTRNHLEPALRGVVSPPEQPPNPWPQREYQEGQRFTRLFDMAGSVAAAQRDFTSLADNYRLQAAMATSEHVAAAKAYYAKWWNRWGESVSFEVARQMAAGPDPRRVAQELRRRIPTINDAFRNRAETIARTETLMASGEALQRTYRRLRVGFVQYEATLDDRSCEWCVPRMGCLYWLGSIRTPIHPNCRCMTTPVTLEGLAIENALSDNPSQHWEARAQRTAANSIQKFMAATGGRGRLRPTGGAGEARGEDADFPLMERTGLPQLERRRGLSEADPENQAAQAWPRGEPVWCPRRGWLDPAARQAYEQIQREVSRL